MPVFNQRSATQDYLEQCDVAKAQGLQNILASYNNVRCVYLGAPVPAGMNQQNQPMFAISGDIGMKLRERIAAHGSNFGEAMMEAETLRQFAEQRIEKAIADIGGVENIRANGTLGFLLGLCVLDENNRPVKYRGLDSNPFVVTKNATKPNQLPSVYEATLIVNGDGTGDVQFKLLSGTGGAGDPI